MLSDGFVVEVLKQITDERLQKVDLGAGGGGGRESYVHTLIS